MFPPTNPNSQSQTFSVDSRVERRALFKPVCFLLLTSRIRRGANSTRYFRNDCAGGRSRLSWTTFKISYFQLPKSQQLPPGESEDYPNRNIDQRGEQSHPPPPALRNVPSCKINWCGCCPIMGQRCVEIRKICQ